MKLITIETPQNWSPAADRAEYLDRFTDDIIPEREAGRHIEDAVETLHAVLDAILTHLLRKECLKTRVVWSTLDVTDKCSLLRWAFGRSGDRGVGYQARMQEHIAAVEHYDRERSRLLQAEFKCPGSLTLVEMADIADTLMTAAMELEEAMVCENHHFAPVINAAPLAEAA